MQSRKTLIENDKINTEFALELYQQAFTQAVQKYEADLKQKQEDEADLKQKQEYEADKKDKKDKIKSILAENVVPVLEGILSPLIQGDLTNPTTYSKLEKTIIDWDASHLPPEDSAKCAEVQKALLTVLPDLKKLQHYEENARKYQEYLENIIISEVKKIKKESLLEKLKKSLIKEANISITQGDLISLKVKNDKKIVIDKEKIASALLNQYRESEKQADIKDMLVKNTKLSDALEKLRVMQEAKAILQNKDKIENTKLEEKFFKYLEDNKPILTKRRDNHFDVLVKGLGVAAGTVFGFGIGGYVAYRNLFGSKATRGHEFIHEVSEVRNNKKRP